MIERLKYYLDGLFASVPSSEEVEKAKARLYDRMKDEYEDCIQRGLDHQSAYESVIASVGDVTTLISQLRDSSEETPKSKPKEAQPSNERPTSRIGEFVRNVTDFTSGLFTGMLTGPNPSNLSLVNTITLPLTNINEVKITYLAESILLQQSPDGNLVVREYMNQKEPELLAEVIQADEGHIIIKNGRRKGLALRSRIEVYVPAGWHGALALSTLYGHITTECDWNLNKFSAKSVNGNIEMTNLTANHVKLSSSLGSLTLESCSGNMIMNTVSGEIRIARVSGGGIFGTIAGRIRLYVENLSKPLKLSSENGEIFLHMSKESSYEFNAVSITGIVFSTVNGIDVFIVPNRAHGYVGKAPIHEVEISTSTGSIHIS
jgi:hypothetical protein